MRGVTLNHLREPSECVSLSVINSETRGAALKHRGPHVVIQNDGDVLSEMIRGRLLTSDIQLTQN